jgi:signal transduction histidine kinase
MPNDKHLSKLLSLAVHEFRSPVTVISGYVRMLLQDMAGPLNERQRKLLEDAQRSSHRLAALVAELSDLSHLDGGEHDMQRHPVRVFQLLAEVASNVHEGSDRGVRLEVRGGDPGWTVTGDANRLEKAFSAIFGAILRERPDRCLVLASCSVREVNGTKSAFVLITDESSVDAMSETAPREWGPFDEWRGGMGLTLPIARRVIEAHGGFVWSPLNMRSITATAFAIPLKETDV